MAKLELAPSDYVHLHNHTHYSVLDGLQKVPEMLERIQSLGMQSVAITDHGTLSGAIEFYKEALAKGIKPLIGMETYVAARTIANKDPAKDKSPLSLDSHCHEPKGIRKSLSAKHHCQFGRLLLQTTD